MRPGFHMEGWRGGGRRGRGESWEQNPGVGGGHTIVSKMNSTVSKIHVKGPTPMSKPNTDFSANQTTVKQNVVSSVLITFADTNVQVVVMATPVTNPR